LGPYHFPFLAIEVGVKFQWPTQALQLPFDTKPETPVEQTFAIIRWVPDGDVICILDENKPVEKILPRYFMKSKIYDAFENVQIM
jgi:hypothetical protein